MKEEQIKCNAKIKVKRWSDKTTLQFVTKYTEHECLWNINSHSYKNQAMKEYALFDIAKTMGIPGFDKKQVKIKIRGIRTTYAQEIRKIKESELSASAIYVPSIKWFPVLHNCLQNLKRTYKVLYEKTYDEGSLKPEDDAIHWEFPESLTNISNVEHHEEVGEELQVEQNVEIHQTNAGVDELATNIARCEKNDENVSSTASTSSSCENEHDIFGKLVAIQLRSLPAMLALEAQQEIQNVLTQIRRKYLTDHDDSC